MRDPRKDPRPVIGADYVHRETGEVREVASCDGVTVEYFVYDIDRHGEKRSSFLASFIRWAESAEVRP